MNTKKNSGSFRTGGETIIAKACRIIENSPGRRCATNA
jgi:hypothetical protein